MKVLDRYVAREFVGPFSLALGLFTFLFAVRPMLDNAQDLLAKGVDMPTVGWLLLLLLPQALGITIPMAFMAASLMALGRLSGDREGVALLACGVSPLRVLRPILLLAVLAGGANAYTLMRLVPDANQKFREETFALLVKKSEADIKPGVFYQGFPGKVLFVRERLLREAGWAGVVLVDTTQPMQPRVTLAERGHLDIDPVQRQVAIVLPGPSRQYLPGQEAGVYDTAIGQDLRFSIPADSVFGDGNLTLMRGRTEMSYSDLRNEQWRKYAAGYSPHAEIMQRQQMFSFPVACLVFAVIGLALGLHTRKEGKLGGFAIGIAVIAAYYGLMVVFENLTKGNQFPAEWSRWMPDIILGLVGIAAVRWRSRFAGHELTLRLPRLIRWRRKAGAAAEATAKPHIVLVIRIPDIHLPRPRLLDLYVGRRYLNVVSFSFFGLLAFYYIATFIDKSERLFKGQADPWMLAQYFWFSTPQFVAYIVPMAILVAVLATVGGLTRSGELVVMRSCGVSLYRAAVPLLAIALVWSAGLFILDDRVLAKANRKAESLEDTIKGLPPRLGNAVASSNWRIDRERIYYYVAFNPAEKKMFGLSVLEMAEAPFRLALHVRATDVTLTGKDWVARDGWVQHFPLVGQSTRETFTTRRVRMPINFPGTSEQEPEMMTFLALRQQIRELADSGLGLADARVTLQERIAFPLVAVVMTLLGIPFGALTGRRGALYSMGLALILGSAYWLVNTFFLAVGQAALLPAPLAAWSANLLFLAAAGYLTLTVRT